jgi:hypothetical protein
MTWLNIMPKKSDIVKEAALGLLNWLSIGILFFGIVIVLLFGATIAGKATILLWMLAFILLGTAVGFLFGIPKILQNNQAAPAGTVTNATGYQQLVNTNLTEISDWLTKIIVGLGLVNLSKIAGYLSTIASILAKGLSKPPVPPSALAFAFSYAVVISYTILGFLFGYITTRLYLAPAFSRADRSSIEAIAQQSADAVSAANSALQKAEFALVNPAASAQKANQTPQQQLEKSIEAYNSTRQNMSSGSARTSKMSEIVKEMTIIVPSLTDFDVSQALAEADNGTRLSGYAYLYAKPDPQYLAALVDSFTTDPTPFGQYWGIQALGKIMALKANQDLPVDVLKKIKNYYNQLSPGIDREYELRKLFPQLKN